MRNLLKVITIGVYGYEEHSFFEALRTAKIDLFCDVRNRRGMRGSQYAFVNSKYLQDQLRQMNIQYIHLKALSPPPALRNIQKNSDFASGTAKRQRAVLSSSFVEAYRTEILNNFNLAAFLNHLPVTISTIAFFCVEREPSACHRSIIAAHLKTQYNLDVEDLMPWKS